MSECECTPKCPFFNDQMSNMPATATIFKKRYCETDATDCARHIVFKALGRENVPKDLYPNQVERANTIVSSA